MGIKADVGGDSEEPSPLEASRIEDADSEPSLVAHRNDWKPVLDSLAAQFKDMSVAKNPEGERASASASDSLAAQVKDTSVAENPEGMKASASASDSLASQFKDTYVAEIPEGMRASASASDSVSAQFKDMSVAKNPEGKRASASASKFRYWDLLPPEVDALILACLGFFDLFRARLVCRSFRDVVKRKTFQQARGGQYPVECSLGPLVFYVKGGNWHILGFEYKAQIWRKLPYLDSRPVDPEIVSIPVPDIDLFKDFLVSVHGGVFCVNVGKPNEAEKILVFNPLNGSAVQLPPLLFPRNPVVLHVHTTLTKVDNTLSSRYWILAVGSASTGTESLSRKTEVYDSVKGVWEEAGEVPGTDYSINEHQSGVYCQRENFVCVTGFTVDGSKGVLVFDMGTRAWREDLQCPYLRFPFDEIGGPVHFALAQLVECNGKIFLFSEQEADTMVTHCIDALNVSSGAFRWTRKLSRPRQGYRALLVYPEFTCVPMRENKLCIYNTIERTGVVYNMLDDPINPEVYETIPVSPPLDDGVVFHSLNPVGYAYEPSFGVWAK